LPFLVAVPAIAAITFALGWHVPPNNWDSLTYHLPRAAYWRQWGSLGHFPTDDLRQTAFPGTAEVLILATLLIAHSAQLAFLVQWTAYLAATCAVYGLGRQIGLEPVYALCGAGTFACLPEVVLQSTTEQNDLTAAAFLVCGAYFLLDAMQRDRRASLLFTGVALGLAVGTKPTAMLALPGLLLGVLMLWRPSPRTWLGTGLLAALLALALAAPWYVENLLDFGSLNGPPAIAGMQTITHPTIQTFAVNLERHLIGFLDPAGPAYLASGSKTLACTVGNNLTTGLARLLRIPAHLPALDFPFWPGAYDPRPACTFQEDGSWYGLGGLLILGCVLACSLRRRRNPAIVLALAALSFLLGAALLLRWQPWEGRLLVPFMALGAPLSGLLYRALCRHRLWPLAQVLVLYVAAGGVAAAIDSQAKPLSAWATLDQLPVAYGQISPAVLDSYVPSTARLAIYLDGDDWEFPLFGPRLTRTVIPLALDDQGRVHAADWRFDYLLTHQTPAVSTQVLRDLPACRRLLWRDNLGTPFDWALYGCTAGHPARPTPAAGPARP
jgi:4-amino-4-deoxy-L-arabinose transferase-like glycosyltransferase